jgi:uncharacterized protein
VMDVILPHNIRQNIFYFFLEPKRSELQQVYVLKYWLLMPGQREQKLCKITTTKNRLMKNLILILFVLLLASCKKESFNPALTEEFSILSVSNGAKYNIKVALPQNYSPETQKYSALYVLDGEEIFDFVAENCNRITSDYGTENVLVVGIGYGNDRAFDYTPSKTDEGGGGAKEFMLFIKNELIPEIETDYSADTSRTNRTILGHSFGGLCGAYAFANFNNVFANYIIISPSLWYDNEIVLKQEQENRSMTKNNYQLVFLGLGELEPGRMQAPFKAFYQVLQNNYPNIIIKSHIEPQLNHRGSEKPDIIEGLKFYFKKRS